MTLPIASSSARRRRGYCPRTVSDYSLYARDSRTTSPGKCRGKSGRGGVYDCRWGTDVVRVIVAGQLPREEHNAPLHLFSASPELVGFGRGAYRQRSENTSQLLTRLFQRLQGEEFAMSYTMEDFRRDFFKEQLAKLKPEEQQDVLQSLPPEVLQSLPLEKRLAGLTVEQIQHYLETLTAGHTAEPRKPRRKK